MISVCFSSVKAILCQLPATSNPKTVGGMCYAVLDVLGLKKPIMVQIINNHQSWPGLQQTPLGKHQSEIANHRPGKTDTASQHASAKPDMLSQHAKCRQAIQACIAKDNVYKGLQEPKSVDKPWESGEPDSKD